MCAMCSPTPTVVREGFLSQKRPALCKATRRHNSVVRINYLILYSSSSILTSSQVKGTAQRILIKYEGKEGGTVRFNS